MFLFTSKRFELIKSLFPFKFKGNVISLKAFFVKLIISNLTLKV